jgi:hypothetical protein
MPVGIAATARRRTSLPTGLTLPRNSAFWGRGAALNSSPLNYGLPSVQLSIDSPAQRAAAELLAVADHLAFRDAELDSRQAQPALWRRLSPRASRLSRRLEFATGALPSAASSPRTRRRSDHRLGAGGFSAWAAAGDTPSIRDLNKSYLRDNVMGHLRAGRLARAAQPDADLRLALRVLCAVHREVWPPGSWWIPIRRAASPP